MLTNVYVDGFNLYYGCLKDSPYKWLDLNALCHQLLPRHEIHRIRYFTAKISARLPDLQSPIRQETYLRALETLPGLTVHLGHFLTGVTRMRLVTPLLNGPKTVEVIKTEEKGSDVNLATYLVADAFRHDADIYVLISNDSDLFAPMRLVRHELDFRVGLINPHLAKKRSRALLSCEPTFFKQIRPNTLAKCQFPDQIVSNSGVITRPITW